MRGRGESLHLSSSECLSLQTQVSGKNCSSLFSLLQLSFDFEPVSASHLAGRKFIMGIGSFIPYSRGNAGVLGPSSFRTIDFVAWKIFGGAGEPVVDPLRDHSCPSLGRGFLILQDP